MTEFIWIVSFPKSGSTWVRFMAAHLMFGGDGKLPNVSEVIPDIHEYTGPLEHIRQGAYPAKTHFPKYNIPPTMRTRSMIHVIRNPLDVVDSAIAYLKPDTSEDRGEMIEAFCKYGGVEPWRTILNYGSWNEHADSWLGSKHDFPCLCFRYEDMLLDPYEHVRKLADFLSIEVSESRIKEIAENTSFSSMRAIEDEEVETGKSGFFNDEQVVEKPDFRFMRQGKSGTYKENLSEQEIARLTEHFRPAMEAYGYL